MCVCVCINRCLWHMLIVWHYKVRTKGKWRNPGKRVAASPTL